jgi:cytochrome c oxidase assembly protein subunit 15
MAWITAIATLYLICVGGMVTSQGVGMAVPDWPNSFGYNMFLLPWDRWSEGGAFWEHSHRLKGSLVGLLTLITAVWLGLSGASVGLKRLGWIALAGVVLQGLLGGLRVVFNSELVANTNFGVVFGICHAALGQLFFVLLGVLVLKTSGFWQRIGASSELAGADAVRVKRMVWIGVLAIFGQLLIGATMRHQHAGLAIPDFPLAYGGILPSAEAVERVNHLRSLEGHLPEITGFQIWLHMAHRFVAYGIAVWVGLCLLASRRAFPQGHVLRRFSTAWAVLIALQVFLGAFTIWSGKAADVATAHVAVGALSLMTGTLFAVLSFRLILSSESGSLRRSSAALPSGVANR